MPASINETRLFQENKNNLPAPVPLQARSLHPDEVSP